MNEISSTPQHATTASSFSIEKGSIPVMDWSFCNNEAATKHERDVA